MLVWLAFGVLLLLGGLAVVRWFVGADPRLLATAARTAGIVALVLVVLGLALTGRLGWLLAVLPLIVPLLWRRGWGGGAQPFPSGGGPAASGVRTAYLDMQLDHRSGSLDGEVLQGRHTGRRLSQLLLADLLELLRSIDGADRKSALLLEAYLDRRFPDWRQGGDAGAGFGGAQHAGAEQGNGSAASAAGGAMSHDEALRILGLAPGASAAEIKAAHLRLIAIVHPDRGGSPFLAAQVNRARDVLLGHGAGA